MPLSPHGHSGQRWGEQRERNRERDERAREDELPKFDKHDDAAPQERDTRADGGEHRAIEGRAGVRKRVCKDGSRTALAMQLPRDVEELRDVHTVVAGKSDEHLGWGRIR